VFAACTAARIGEVSGVRAADIDPATWMWTVRQQTTPGPGGLIDKGAKRARTVPLIEDIRPTVTARLASTPGPEVRLFTAPKGGRISTTVLRDATHWDDVVRELGHEHLVRHMQTLGLPAAWERLSPDDRRSPPSTRRSSRSRV
jgi:integrase